MEDHAVKSKRPRVSQLGAWLHSRFRPGIAFSFTALFLLLANGRMDSGDANAQLQAAFNLVTTGTLGEVTENQDPRIQKLFVPSPNGRFYEGHDVGNSLLMTPATAVAVVLAHFIHASGDAARVGVYSGVALIVAKSLTSLTGTLVSALGCWFLFRFFLRSLDSRTSARLTLLFAFGTMYAGFFRAAWDVVPACNASCILLYYCAGILDDDSPKPRDCVLAGFWFGVIGLFRCSYAPFSRHRHGAHVFSSPQIHPMGNTA